MRFIVIAIAGFLTAGFAPAQDAAFDPASGYRIPRYRAVVPAPPQGVARVDARAVAALVDRDDAILVDVVPAEGGVRDPATGVWRSPRSAFPAQPGSPRRGAVGPIRRSRAGSIAASHAHRKHRARAIVVFCLADCWMRWNAAWRLSRAGYARVLWFAEDADGWRDIGRPLFPVTPYDPAKAH